MRDVPQVHLGVAARSASVGYDRLLDLSYQSQHPGPSGRAHDVQLRDDVRDVPQVHSYVVFSRTPVCKFRVLKLPFEPSEQPAEDRAAYDEQLGDLRALSQVYFHLDIHAPGDDLPAYAPREPVGLRGVPSGRRLHQQGRVHRVPHQDGRASA